MALQVQVCDKLAPKNGVFGSSVVQTRVHATWSTEQTKILDSSLIVRVACDRVMVNKGGCRGMRLRVKSSLDGSATAATPVPVVGQVTEVNKDTFWPIVNAAGDKIVVLDMHTQRCGPCKVMTPKFLELSEKYLDVVFLKLDCNQENKPLAKELGIRVVPTFKIFKDSKIVNEVKGAKFDDLVFAIESVRSS